VTAPKIDARCPACGVLRVVNWRYNHRDDCEMGPVEKRAAEADRVWFDSGSRKVERPATWAEIALVEAAGLELPEHPQTIVRRYGSPERTIGGHGPVW
jgi:hypothetical protein